MDNKGLSVNNNILGVDNKTKMKLPVLNRTCIEILKLIDENNQITQNEIVTKLKCSRTIVTRNMKRLVDWGYIKREGSNKLGYWKVLK